MKIFYVGVSHEYYDPARAHSFEHANFYLSLRALPGVEVVYLPFDRIATVGRAAFNAELLDAVRREKPDLFFAFMYTDEFDPVVLDEIKRLAPSLAWFADDHWRLEAYSRFWAPHFTYVVTTWSKAKEEYARYGITNVLSSQWACNSADYHPVGASQDIEVSFVGMRTPNRARIVAELARRGIVVETWGAGWNRGKLPFPELVRLFSRSKINLNLNPPMSAFALKPLAQVVLRRSSYRGLPDFLHWPLRKTERAIIDVIHLPMNIRSYFRKKIPQIKARPFEIAGCGGFCISGLADDMEAYYAPDREMVFYRNLDDLAQKIRYYLDHENERRAIARAGYERTMREHTYAERFRKLFAEIPELRPRP